MGYTQDIENDALQLFKLESASIYNSIQSMPAETTREQWKQIIENIACEYRLSSRFAIMRILQARGRNCKLLLDGNLSKEAFTITAGGKSYTFPWVSLDEAGNLSAETSERYIELLFNIASDHQAACNGEALTGKREIKKVDALIRIAWFNAQDSRKLMLTRKDAIMLGHILDFSIEEIQFFLTRVFDVGESFRMNRSDDLIDFYGFLRRSSLSHVQELKERYTKESADIQKEDFADRNNGWTGKVSGEIINQFDAWRACPETMDDQFMTWILGKASGLDLYSHTACMVFRNLSAYACNLENGKSFIPDPDEFYEKIQEICGLREESMAAKMLFRRDGKLSAEKCEKVAETLLRANNERSGSLMKARANAWHIPKLDMHGELMQTGVVNSNPDRLLELLTGKEEVEKSDMLLLFWFTANVTWQFNADSVSSEALTYRLMDFMDCANALLQSALLPEFYVPHILERSMLLSIVRGADAEDPSVVYANILLSLVRERNEQKSARGEKRTFEKHDESFKIMVIEDYRAHPEMTLAECAAKYGVSDQSISLWQKKFLAQGKVK